MKKITVILALLLVFTTASVFATGLGIQAGPTFGHGGFNPNFAVTFKLNSSPWVFAVDGYFTDYAGGVGISADQWVINQAIASPINFYFGWGIYVGMGFTQNSSFDVAFGGRAPIGINAFLFKKQFEPYIQIVPSIGARFGTSGFSFPDWGVAGNIGFRFWF